VDSPVKDKVMKPVTDLNNASDCQISEQQFDIDVIVVVSQLY
jgi:hypothetical protein